ncbi:L-glutamine:scyllo-inosose aminotransferase/L-glutamine:2-deoxy-scyllo-inosose/3-amino-2,3-dideoxy-scyllo-inosose aminotransferase [Rhizobiales bacterium GAS113]|nr:L-glutamine:scyllo-inosose aminotransferase/L-glutamine:2-deoxy-scyllo-inosose/3-amino-2,3-dideoxy-scyllo-inosose aminotransferase [Rhizobiales bacterium GAS113]SED87004.1 L-glutamine:scyllo-inosose aminotransferase/L-glutamine:2-deoxy-scyllo-inosose/3-amino-2,3-dideoxy-scyllo-inosose aminotransferase [Rhizobiales bacterium GAS188]
MNELALKGGTPIRTAPWPQWPRSTAGLEQQVIAALRNGRWSISGLATDGHAAHETQFAHAFAEYNGVEFCIPTANGTSALMCAMQALDIGAGDEVIVPGLTWVACATAVMALNAIPVLVDVDPLSLCLDPAAVRQAITGRTRAIMAVHLYNAIADLDALLALSTHAGIPLIEDCAQAHGARWRGRRVGTIGTVGTFSMQNGKVLTSGEGGACICRHGELADRIYRLRSDGRRLVTQPAPQGRMDLEDIGGVFGQNFCLSEIQAAILCSRLADLDEENAQRAHCADRLRRLLTEIGGFGLQQSAPGTEATTLYHFPVRLEGVEFDKLDASTVGAALSAELGCWIHQPYAPLDQHPLLATGSPRRFAPPAASVAAQSSLPRACEAYHRCVVLPHWLFLSSAKDIDDIAAGFDKVKRSAHRLRT